MSLSNNRRDFLKTTGLAGVGFWVAGNTFAQQSKSANEKVNYACIGVGGKGGSDSDDARNLGNVVAICDVDDKTLESASKRFPGAKIYTDYRKMLEEMGKEIDAVTVSTPDHCHAAAAGMAMKMGKAAFSQKPMTHSIYEARRLGEIAREMKVATQMGNQGTSESGLREAAAIIKSGGIGTVSEVHVWTNRPIWAQGGPRPEEKPVPEQLHWEQWIGPAKFRPYAPGYHPFAWRGWWDFGTGALGDMACHTMNMPFMGLDLRDPTSVSAETSGHNKDSYPKSSVIRYEFPANDKRPALTLTWYDGGKMPSKDLFGEGISPKNSGSLTIGDKGKIYSPDDYGASFEILGGAQKPKVDFKRSPGHFKEFDIAIKGGEPAVSNFPDYASPLTETVLLGNLAVYAGTKVEWDAKALKAKNMPELDEMIRPKYREGYTEL